MVIMREAIDLEDWERMEKGLKPRPKKKVEMPEPEAPEVADQIFLKDVLKEKFINLAGVRRRTVRNKDGVMFLGFDVSVDVEGKTLNGWMSEKDIRDLMQLYKDKIDSRLRGVI